MQMLEDLLIAAINKGLEFKKWQTTKCQKATSEYDSRISRTICKILNKKKMMLSTSDALIR